MRAHANALTPSTPPALGLPLPSPRTRAPGHTRPTPQPCLIDNRWLVYGLTVGAPPKVFNTTSITVTAGPGPQFTIDTTDVPVKGRAYPARAIARYINKVGGPDVHVLPPSRGQSGELVVLDPAPRCC